MPAVKTAEVSSSYAGAGEAPPLEALTALPPPLQAFNIEHITRATRSLFISFGKRLF